MDIVVGGIPLIVLILGLVEFVKKFKVAGNALIIVSMVIGTAFGVLYKVSLEYTIVNKYFEWAVFGLACGLSACGLFDLVKNLLSKDQVVAYTVPLEDEPKGGGWPTCSVCGSTDDVVITGEGSVCIRCHPEFVVNPSSVTSTHAAK